MRVLGIIGGIAPESTVDYYRSLITRFRALDGTGAYPRIVINSIDLTAMLVLVAEKRLDELAAFLAGEIGKLQAAGAQFALLASNTPHVVFDRMRAISPLPLISIVECAREVALARGWKRLGLFGTRFTMDGGFYAAAFAAAGMEIVLPRPEEREFIHDRYMSELVNGDFRDETRTRLIAIIGRLRDDEQVDAVILGGTELPLLLRQPEVGGVALLDTTRAHVEAAVAGMLA
jgi:aspartate racemase